MIKIGKPQIIGVGFALALLAISIIFFRNDKIFYFLLSVCVVIATLPFMMSLMANVNKEKEKEDMFLEFARNLVESVKSGTPISKSIINVKDKDYGSLTRHVQKLANQIALGIPVKSALKIFANDIDNIVITRSVALISEAEQAGGVIDTILESVAKSVNEIEDVKKEQKAAVYNLVIQGYIIFIIFIIIMLVTEMKIIPMTVGMASSSAVTSLGGMGSTGGGGAVDPEKMSQPFLILLIVQGFFAGLVIGKLSEGKIKSGLIHSFILVLLAVMLTTLARAVFSK
jgi:archaeal flagellar protein FlaJ